MKFDSTNSAELLQPSLTVLTETLNAVSYPIFIKDQQHRWVYLNDAACELFTDDRATLIGKSDYDYFSAEQAAIFWAEDDKIFQTGQPSINYENLTNVHGYTKTLKTTKRLFQDEQGHPFLIGSIEDQTDYPNLLRQMELEMASRSQNLQPLVQQLYEQRYLLDGIVTHSRGMVFFMDQTGCFTYISPNFHTITGHDVAATVGQHFAPLVHPEDIHICNKAFEQLLLTQQPQNNLEYRVLHRDGNFYWHCANLVLLTPPTGPSLVLGLTLDIHDRRCAEEELKVSQEKFQRFAANVPGMLYQFQITAQGESRFLYVNDFCHNFFGISPEAVISGEIVLNAHLHPDDVDSFEQSVMTSMMTLQPWDMEWRAVNPQNQSIKWFHAQSIPVRQPDGSTIWDGIMLEITDRKLTELAIQESKREFEIALHELQQTQTQLVQSEKMSSLGQLVAGVAHEINNPMSFICGNLEHADIYINYLLELIQLYQTHYSQTIPEIQAYAKKIDLEFVQLDLPKLLDSMKVGSQRVNDIVLNLRNFSRMDEAEIKDVDLHDGLDSTIMILKHRLQRSNGNPKIKLEKKYGDIPRISCHAGQLNQVFMNLIANAIDALDERDDQRTPDEIWEQPSTIEISTEYDRDLQVIQIKIRDNGIGIPEPIKAKLFNPFFTTKPIGKGTGMGLAISYQVVTEKHAGRLICRSQPGAGTEFVIELPLVLGELEGANHSLMTCNP